MSEKWNPAGLLINRAVVDGLKNGLNVGDYRCTGKTETLLAYIALHHEDAIIVAELRPILEQIKCRWKSRYPKLPLPRLLTMRQFEVRDGISGTVFTEECYLSERALGQINPFLLYAGGVHSL